MSRVDPEMLDQMESGSGIQTKKDAYGTILAWKGPWLPDWYDNYTEMLRENQNARRVELLKKAGLNENAQTPEQAKAFKEKQKIQMIRKQKAEAALLASNDFSEGK